MYIINTYYWKEYNHLFSLPPREREKLSSREQAWVSVAVQAATNPMYGDYSEAVRLALEQATLQDPEPEDCDVDVAPKEVGKLLQPCRRVILPSPCNLCRK